ncbi:transposase [Streptomyces sp. NPDC056534]|uniref:transposase n=1 Tax=Streptomyces sp. NPDC056534 TaxID=3345857 RepID=UPI0036B6D29A
MFCHVYARGDRGKEQFVPGWPYSFVAALETGRTSWYRLLDAQRIGPADDATSSPPPNSARPFNAWSTQSTGSRTTPRS